MMLDVKRLKTIHFVCGYASLYLFELVYFSNHKVCLIIKNDKIIYKYRSLSWAHKRFLKCLQSYYPVDVFLDESSINLDT